MSQSLRVMRIGHSANMPLYRDRDRSVARNHAVDLVVVAPKTWKHFGGVDNNLIEEPFVLERIGTVLSGNVPLFSYDVNRLISLLKRYQPQVIDIHEEPYSVSGYQISWLAKQLLPSAKQIFYSAQNIHKKYPIPFCWTEQFVFRTAAGAYPCSSGVQQVLREKGFSKPSPVIPLGVNTLLFHPRQHNDKEPEIIQQARSTAGLLLGYFGRLEHCKGVEFLLKALSNVSSSTNVSLFICGSGEHEDRLRSQAKELGLEKAVIWLGEISADAVPEYMSCLDGVVIPSITTNRWKEQFGRVAIEAMACQIPVIASNSGSLPEVVDGAGLVVPEQDVDSLANAIRTLGDRQVRSRLGSRGVQLVAEKYTWDAVALQIFQLYRQCYENSIPNEVVSL